MVKSDIGSRRRLKKKLPKANISKQNSKEKIVFFKKVKSRSRL